MEWFSKEEIQEAREVDLFTYLRCCEPKELVPLGGETYCTRTHDSLKISNGVWMWWSRGIGGKSALDYLIKVRGLPFQEAVGTLLKQNNLGPMRPAEMPKSKPKVLELPRKSWSCQRVVSYLCGRGIDPHLVRQCIRDGTIYESYPHHDAVFVGRDEEGVPRYATCRSTDEKRIFRDCFGSDKRFAFRLQGTDKDGPLHLFESAIDLLSYATLCRKGSRKQKETLLSVGGVFPSEQKLPIALEAYLNGHPDTKEVHLHFDNDNAGRETSAMLKLLLSPSYRVADEPPPAGKDCNDYLRSITRTNQKGRSYER